MKFFLAPLLLLGLCTDHALANVAFQSELKHLTFETHRYKVEISVDENRRIDRFRIWVGGKELRVAANLYREIVHPSLLEVQLFESAGDDGAELQVPVLICDEHGLCGKKEVWSFGISSHEFQFNQHYTSAAETCDR